MVLIIPGDENWNKSWKYALTTWGLRASPCIIHKKNYVRREGAGGCIKSEMKKKKDDDDKREGKMHRGLFTI